MGKDVHQSRETNNQSIVRADQSSGGESSFLFEDNRPETLQLKNIQQLADNSPRMEHARQLQAVTQLKINRTGLPDNLKSGIENLSGYSMDNVKVHYNSGKPAGLGAHAYAQGTDIHVAPGQEEHLPHEAWHVVQQKQGRVKATRQLKGISINDHNGLEKEADEMGKKALGPTDSHSPGELAEGLDSSTVQRVILDENDEPYEDEILQELLRDESLEIRLFVMDLHNGENADEVGFDLDMAIDLAREMRDEDVLSEESSDEEEDPMEATLIELAKVEVDVSMRHNLKTYKVNLGEYFDPKRVKENKKKYPSHLVTQQALIEAVDEEYVLVETDPKRDPDRLAALHWVREELAFSPRKSSGGGGGKVKVEYDSDEISVHGRPGFEKNAQGLPGMVSGFHRRHIVAWHTLKNALENVVNQLIKLQGKDSGILQATTILAAISNKIGPDEEPPKKDIPQKKKKKTEKPVVPTKGSSSPDDLVLLMERVLTKINSNILNLWPGDGYENSLINTYQGLFKSWSVEVSKLDTKTALEWQKTKVEELAERAKGKKGRYGQVIEQFMLLLSQWKAASDKESAGLQLSRFLAICADNFEVDYPVSPDRSNFESGHTISSGILGMAGALLDWADGGEKAFNKKKAFEIGFDLEEFLNEFMFPTKGKKMGNDGKSSVKGKSQKGKSDDLDFDDDTIIIDKSDDFKRTPIANFVSVPQIGNSCYIASVMNTVLTIATYSRLFLNNPGKDHMSPAVLNVLNTGRELLLAMNAGKGTPELVEAFRTAMIRAGWLGGNIGHEGRQQDAGELLTFLLDLLGNDVRLNREHRWQDRGNNAVMNTGHASDHMLNLGGLHYSGETRSINDLLNVDLDRNRFDAEQVNQDTIRDHNWRLEGNLPQVLTIQLNRFKFSSLLGKIFKLKEKIAAPLQLTIPDNLTNNGDAVYRLSSFIIHVGESVQGGHYYSYQRRGDRWFLVNDADVSEVTIEEVQARSAEAYLLCYEKQ